MKMREKGMKMKKMKILEWEVMVKELMMIMQIKVIEGGIKMMIKERNLGKKLLENDGGGEKII